PPRRGWERRSRPHDVRQPPDTRRRHVPEYPGARRRRGEESGRAQAGRQDAGPRADRRTGTRRRRVSGEPQVMSWLATVDHKRIGVLYGVTAFVFFLLGGLEALVIRL